MGKKLTPMQEKFLDALFGEAQLDERKAADLAGYAETTMVGDIMAPLQEEIGKRMYAYMGTRLSLKSVRKLEEILDGRDNPLGRKERITAAKDFLDRAGFKGVEKVEVTASEPIVLLPPKNAQDPT